MFPESGLESSMSPQATPAAGLVMGTPTKMSCDVLLKEKKLLPESNNARLLPQTVAIDEDPVIKKKRTITQYFLKEI